jgi:hypothetical protein
MREKRVKKGSETLKERMNNTEKWERRRETRERLFHHHFTGQNGSAAAVSNTNATHSPSTTAPTRQVPHHAQHSRASASVHSARIK